MNPRHCKTCGTELKTMVAQGMNQCSSCEAKQRDTARASELDVYARLERLEEAVSTLIKIISGPPPKGWKKITPQLEVLRAFMGRR